MYGYREKGNLDYSAEVLEEHRIGARVGRRTSFGDCGQHLGSSTTHDLTLILHFSLDLGTNPSVVKGGAEHNDDNKKTGAMSWGELTELGSSFNTFGLGRGPSLLQFLKFPKRILK